MLKKNLRGIFLISMALAAIVVWHELSAQTDNRNMSIQIGIAKNSQSVSSSFNITAEIVEMNVIKNSFRNQDSGISIAPPFLVFTDKKPTGEITISNVGEIVTVYRIRLINTLIDEKGNRSISIKPIWAKERKSSRFADKLLRFAPRKITLKPGEQQLIRISATIPERILDGEYRSELSFSISDNIDSDNTQHFDLKQIIGSTQSANNVQAIENAYENPIDFFVPLMIRKGQTHAKVSFGAIRLEDSEQTTILHLTLNRKGNRSTFGELNIYGLDKNEEKTGLLKTFNHIALFHPNTSQLLSINLSDILNIENGFNEGLSIEYKGRHDDVGEELTTSIKLHSDSRAAAPKSDLE